MKRIAGVRVPLPKATYRAQQKQIDAELASLREEWPQLVVTSVSTDHDAATLIAEWRTTMSDLKQQIADLITEAKADAQKLEQHVAAAASQEAQNILAALKAKLAQIESKVQ